MTDISNATSVSLDEVDRLARVIMTRLGTARRAIRYIYGIPTGGTSTALAIARYLPEADYLCEPPARTACENTLIVDDVMDSGKTLLPYLHAGFKCAVLHARANWHTLPNLYAGDALDQYVVYPWEGAVQGPEDAVRRLLQYIGRDPDEPNVKDTPRRVLSWLAEFDQRREPEFVATAFDGFEYDGMVLVRGIPFTSLCEHHLLPFAGEAVVAYIPQQGRVLGLSKLARIVQHYAHRATVQERLTGEIAQAIAEAVGSGDVGVVLTANHMCMSFRGPKVPTHETITSSLLGAFLRKRTRAEFMALAQR